MSTRVTSAIASRNARENLVRLLFPKEHLAAGAGTTVPAAPSIPPAHRHDTDRRSPSRRRRWVSDNAPSARNAATATDRPKRHSYSQLRAMYLRKVHAMHPDKMAHQGGKQQSAGTEDAHLQFIELKNAWEKYHATVRIAQRRNNDEGSKEQHLEDDFWEEEDNFTMFGVGCSFADSPEERDLRNEIMDQASRGWFPSGSISAGGRTKRLDGVEEDALNQGGVSILREAVNSNAVLQPWEKLSDDDMFVCDGQSANEDCTKRKWLIHEVP